jgi:hypothetical protein
MAEDQGVNGDRWTDHATVLLRRLGWEKVADSNIDIPGNDGLEHGIDSLFKYEDGARVIKEGVFVEAKNYATTSFSASKIKDWVATLDEKIDSLRKSSDFYETYPAMSNTKARNGLLVMWFSDIKNFDHFKPKLLDAMLSVNTPKSRSSRASNRLFVMANDEILRLCSLANAVQDWEKDFAKDGSENVKFVYPSNFKKPVQQLPTLNLEYMYSKFILARSEHTSKDLHKTSDIVFYFGKNNTESYARLRDGLLTMNAINRSNDLYIYQYNRDIDFRKIKPDVEKLFKEEGYPQVTLRSMDQLADLPTWMIDAR